MNQAVSIHKGNGPAGRSATIQHWGALIGGGALAVYGITRRSPVGYALAGAGGVLAYVGATADKQPRELVAETSILLNTSAEKAYNFWRNFENLPRFLHHLASVTVTSDRRSRWAAYGPLGMRIQWETEIVNERENESISWQSLPGSDLEVDGSIEFRPAPGNRGTLVHLRMIYKPPVGALGHAVAKILGKDPNFLARQDLRRFKALIETGEIPTTEGQSHGPRDVLAAVVRLADPDRPLLHQFRHGKGFKQIRRMA